MNTVEAHNAVQALIDRGEELQQVLNVIDWLDCACAEQQRVIERLTTEVRSLRDQLAEAQDALEEDKPMATLEDIERLFRESLSAALKSTESTKSQGGLK